MCIRDRALAERTEPFDLITLCEPESPSGTLRETLTAAGRTVRSLPLYRTAPLPLREPERVERMLRDFTGSEVDTLVCLLARLEENLAGDEYRGRTALSLAEAADCPAKSDGEEKMCIRDRLIHPCQLAAAAPPGGRGRACAGQHF